MLHAIVIGAREHAALSLGGHCAAGADAVLSFYSVCSKLLGCLLKLFLCCLRIRAGSLHAAHLPRAYDPCLVFDLYMNRLVRSRGLPGPAGSVLALRLGAAGPVVAHAPVHCIIHDACFVHGLSLPAERILSGRCAVNWGALALVVADDTAPNNAEGGGVLALSLLLNHLVILLNMIYTLLVLHRALQDGGAGVDVAGRVLFHL